MALKILKLGMDTKRVAALTRSRRFAWPSSLPSSPMQRWPITSPAGRAVQRVGLRWWQIDVSYLIIPGMALLGLARDIRVPSPECVTAKRL